MRKAKLLGLRKDVHLSHFILKKNQAFFGFGRAMLKVLEFDKYEWDELGRPYDIKIREPEFDKELDINEFTDTMKVLEREGIVVHIIYGKDKVFMIINTKKDKQELFKKVIKEDTIQKNLSKVRN